jgi:hypothetical protein
MVQADRRETLTGRQPALIEATEAMAQAGRMEIARTVAPGHEGIARFPILICRIDGPEQPSVRQAFRSMANCVGLAFGMDARHVARKFQFQLEVREGLRRDLLEWSSVPAASIVKAIATVIHETKRTEVIVSLERLEMSAMEIEGLKAEIAAMIGLVIVPIE